jgi:hypothetical protein
MSATSRKIANADLRRMLSAVFTLCLLNKDLGQDELDRLIIGAHADARKKIRSLQLKRSKSVDLVLLGSILHRWSRHTNYLDEDARPFPIRARGKSPSIEALFRAEKKSKAFAQGIQDMRKAGFVVRTRAGLFLPRRDSILLHKLTPEMVANLALSIHRLVSTLLHNTSARRKSPTRLIERNALVLDLPRAKLDEFKDFSREQGAAFVAMMNDWLEARRADERHARTKSGRNTLTAGVHLFAFTEPRSR